MNLTAARARLLEAVADGAIVNGYNNVWNQQTYRSEREPLAQSLLDAGYATRVSLPAGDSARTHQWQITDAGRVALAEWRDVA
jgi:hypothetical protein